MGYAPTATRALEQSLRMEALCFSEVFFWNTNEMYQQKLHSPLGAFIAHNLFAIPSIQQSSNHHSQDKPGFLFHLLVESTHHDSKVHLRLLSASVLGRIDVG